MRACRRVENNMVIVHDMLTDMPVVRVEQTIAEYVCLAAVSSCRDKHMDFFQYWRDDKRSALNEDT